MIADPLVNLDESHEKLRQRVQQFAREHLLPVANDIDREERFPAEVMRKLGEAGLLGGTIPRELGGAGMDNVSMAVMVEELGRYSQTFSGLVGGVCTAFGIGLQRYGSDDQKRKYLKTLALGQSFGGIALTEPRSGSDAGGMECSARKVDGGWVLDGKKAWIDGAGHADWFVVYAQSNPELGRKGICAFVVERGTEGFTTQTYRNILGWRSATTGELTFRECLVPDSALLGEVGQGYKIAMSAVGYGRLQVAARNCGGIRACLEASVDYAKKRRIYGKEIAQFQLIQNKIVDMSIALDTGRALTYRVARMLDAGEQARRESSMAKVYTAECFMRSATAAIQIHGAHGISERFPLAQLFRDAKVAEIVEGSNEVQRTLVAEYELGIR